MGKKIEDLSLSAATKFVIDEIKKEFKLDTQTAKQVLADALCRNIVLEEIANEVAYILEKEA